MKITRNILFVFCVVTFYSCIKIQTLPPEPRVEYTSFEIFDTLDLLGNTVKGGELKFYFEDGDGDLGYLPPEAEEEVDSANLFFTLYRINNGVEILAPEDDPLKPSDYRIPYMERQGQNKILKGTISITFLYLFYSIEDSIKYDFYIKDRSGNVSNTASTSVISLFNNGTYTEID
ncbi:MAG: hypothetical protein GYA41_06835 [Bacteroidales bacterium]|nr:hypothetical protein [Bacteroidales bacterium]